ncbi:heterokaryon incompatibility protein-domain-containing protein [Podospora didyma]|uniref:Heterokaryon incompatibility protein-domain-containing protein n=1 Tax=Podospora didyma TaxID=330526 RepID=A0AAE0N3Z7_9PEZI|nr:heterokaryon incompatibility protein-domain-containing protein [Podospora didyma]
MASFQYQPLNDSTTEIRLLRLFDADPNDPQRGAKITAKLYHFRLGKGCPIFAAISYRWSTSAGDKMIQLNNVSFSVRGNVWELLLQLRDYRLRSKRQPHFFWIDSICINQDDVRERNHQVKLMRNVYSSAEAVLVSLGTAADNSDLAMDYLGGLSERFLGTTSKTVIGQIVIPTPESNLRKHPSSKSEESPTSPRDARPVSRAYLGDPDVPNTFHSQVRDAVIMLLSRDYWTRIWIVQEILLARQLYILCGNRRIPWAKLSRLFGTIEYALTSRPAKFFIWSSGALKTPAYRLVKTKEHYNAHPDLYSTGLPIMTLRDVFSASQCADVRDKVYGLLALSSDPIRIDYRNSPRQVYDDVERYVVAAEGIEKSNIGLRLLAENMGLSDVAPLITDAQAQSRLKMLAGIGRPLYPVLSSIANGHLNEPYHYYRSSTSSCRISSFSPLVLGENVPIELDGSSLTTLRQCVDATTGHIESRRNELMWELNQAQSPGLPPLPWTGHLMNEVHVFQRHFDLINNIRGILGEFRVRAEIAA